VETGCRGGEGSPRAVVPSGTKEARLNSGWNISKCTRLYEFAGLHTLQPFRELNCRTSEQPEILADIKTVKLREHKYAYVIEERNLEIIHVSVCSN
jgi:hypothetical protein